MLLKEIKLPLISTSVNRSSQSPINELEKIMQDFGKDVDAIIYHNALIQAYSSTILDLTEEKPKLIREGSIKFVELLKNFD